MTQGLHSCKGHGHMDATRILLVAVLVKYFEDGAERQLVVCSAYLPYDSEDPPPSRELEEFVRYCDSENLYLIVGFDSNAHHAACGSTNCNGRGEALMEFLNSSSLEILNRGNVPTFCSGNRQGDRHYSRVL